MRCKVDSGGTVVTGNGVGGNGGRGGIGSGWCGGDSSSGVGCDAIGGGVAISRTRIWAKRASIFTCSHGVSCCWLAAVG